MIYIGKRRDTLVRHGHYAHIRLDRAERVIGGFCACFCYCVEQCALSYIRKSYYT